MFRSNSLVCSNKVSANFVAILRKYSVTTDVQQNNVKVENSVKPFSEIPGPKSIPIFGSLWNMMPIVGKYYGIEMHKLNRRYQEEYGNIVMLRDLKFTNDILLCFDPKDIETIFRNEGPMPARNILGSVKYYREHVKPEYFQGYDGVFTSDGEQWQEGRSIMNALIMQPRIVKHFIGGFSAIADDFIKRIEYLSSRNERQEMPDDFNHEIMKWALESVGVLSLDTRFGLLQENPDKETVEYLKSANEFFDIIFQIDILPNLSKYISTPMWRKYIATMDKIVEFVRKQCLLARERIEKDGNLKKDVKDMSIIENLIKNYEDKYVFGSVLDIILAGADTTSRVMGAILYHLAVNPDKQEILRKEISKIFPTKSDALTVDKIEKIPYLKAVVKEVFRMNPIGGGLARVTSKDLVLSGYHVPKGTNVVAEQLTLTSREEHFPEAHIFKPERWLRDENNKKPNINPWVMLPFGFGARACVGRRIAHLELEVLTIKILQNFKLEWHREDPKYALTLMYGIVSPLNICIKPLSD